MARVKQPLFSDTAQQQIGKELIYKQYGSRSFVTGYNLPGGVNPFTPSPTQKENRNLYKEAVAEWHTLSASEKKAYNEEANKKEPPISGWNLFYKRVFENPSIMLGWAYYGRHYLGDFLYGEI